MFGVQNAEETWRKNLKIVHHTLKVSPHYLRVDHGSLCSGPHPTRRMGAFPAHHIPLYTKNKKHIFFKFLSIEESARGSACVCLSVCVPGQ